MAPQQLPLDLRVTRADAGAAPMRSACNAAALALVEAWPDWPHRWMCLVGPAGSGKSRLARHLAAAADAPVLGAADLANVDPVTLAQEPAIVIEDVDRRLAAEAELFHLLNAAAVRGSDILMTARLGPAGWPIATADLASRLRTVPATALAPPDDPLLRQYFEAAFAERQLVIEPAVIDYLIVRMERSLHEAAALVERLDRAGLARRRRITRPLAAEILGEAGAAEPPPARAF